MVCIWWFQNVQSISNYAVIIARNGAPINDNNMRK
jgi:hypothetical protein